MFILKFLFRFSSEALSPHFQDYAAPFLTAHSLNNPIICMGCAEKYHTDPSLYIRKQKRRRPSDALDSEAPSSDVEPSDSEMNDDD